MDIKAVNQFYKSNDATGTPELKSNGMIGGVEKDVLIAGSTDSKSLKENPAPISYSRLKKTLFRSTYFISAIRITQKSQMSAGSLVVLLDKISLLLEK